MNRRTAFWILFLIIIVGIGLRSYELTARSLWFDEAFSWRLIQFPFTEMISRDAADVHPPLYYIFLRSWAWVFGSKLIALRAFSVFFAGLTLLMTYVFAVSAWRSRTHALFATAVMAISAWQIAFAWEARMYTLGTFLALASTWFLLKAYRAASKPSDVTTQAAWWILYAITAAAFAYTHYFAFFTIAAHAIFILGIVIKKTKGRIGEIMQWPITYLAAAAAVLATVLYIPWIPTFIQQNMQVQDNYWVPKIGGWSIPDTFFRFFIPTAEIPAHTGIHILLTALPIIFTILGWIWLTAGSKKPHRDADWLVGLCGFIPFILVIVISFVSQSLYQDRFLVFANLFVLLALATLIFRLPWKTARTTAMVVTLVGLSVTGVKFWFELDIPNRPGAHAAAEYIFAHRQDNEPVLVSSPFVYFAIEHYAKEDYKGQLNPDLYSDTGALLHFSGGPILTTEDIVGPDYFNTIQADTLWVVDTNGFGEEKLTPPQEWQAQEERTYPEVFPHQKDVFVTQYRR